MKNYKNKILLVQLVLYIIIFSINVYTQNCFECTGNTADGEKATALGLGNIASGDYSFAAGYQNTAEGYSSISLGRLSYAFGTYSLAFGSNCYANDLSFAFGQNARAVAAQSIAIGRFVETTYSNAIALGASSSGREMVNNIEYSLMVGFNSTQPTLFVGPTTYGESFGKVGIGTTNPMTTLDVNGGLLTKGFAMPTVNVHNGYVLTCDALGNADWAPGSQSLWTMGLSNNIYRLNGNVGIGTDMPLTKFQIGDQWTFIDQEMKSIGFNVAYVYEDYYRINDGPGAILNFEPSGAISMWMAPTGSGGTRIGSFVQSVIFDNEGNVGIGTLETNGYRLAVNGKILAEELKIIGDVLSSDYVFYDDYDLKPLSEVESYIGKHNHLPDVPSAEEFKENGYNVGEMDDLLLRKIEELTLYLIEQQKIIDKQQKDIGLLKKLIEKK